MKQLPTAMRKTRIMCTLGPATESEEKIRDLIEAGADVFRLNMSHARHEWCREVVERIRRLAVEVGRPVGVLFDLQGPSIRTGDVEKPYQLKINDRVEFRLRGSEAQRDISTTVNYEGILKDVSEGNSLIVDNGSLLMEVESIQEDRMICVAKTAGEMGSRRHINLPGVRLNLPALTDKDRTDLQLAVDCDADFVAGSFVRDAGHVRELRKTMVDFGGQAQIVSKLEDQEAIRNLDDIIKESDVIMVARGDLGIEVNIEELPIIQRKIVKRCLTMGRRVIVATHMLESMIENPTPTRAEVTDVANAVFEEADSLMVSGETSVGRHPVRCVNILDRVARRIERSGGLGYGGNAILRSEKQKTIRAANNLADAIPEALLVIFTRSGKTAHQSALLRPRSPIYAFTPEDRVCRALTLTRGVRPYQMDFCDEPKETIDRATTLLRTMRDVKPGTPLVVISDSLQETHTVDSILLVHA